MAILPALDIQMVIAQQTFVLEADRLQRSDKSAACIARQQNVQATDPHLFEEERAQRLQRRAQQPLLGAARCMQPVQFNAAGMRTAQVQAHLVQQFTGGIEAAQQQTIVVVLQLRSLHRAEEAGFGIEMRRQVEARSIR